MSLPSVQENDLGRGRSCAGYDDEDVELFCSESILTMLRIYHLTK
jgi:hypothetical protein